MAMTFAWLVSGLRVQDYWGDFNAHLVRDFPFFAGLVAFCVVWPSGSRPRRGSR